MIRAHGLRREFGKFVAVDDVSLCVPDGTILALLGPNGAGKTTTVRLLAGLLAPSAGEATVAGCDVRADPAGVRARIGLVTDTPGLHDQMTPIAYLDFFGRIYGLDDDTRRRRSDELLGLFELQDFSRTRMAGFSRGMQQKVALARALLHEPSVVFLDEPTAGLDPLAARTVRELIVGLKHASRSIVLCTHDLDEAERLADQVAILRHGRVVAADTAAALRATASIETVVHVVLGVACAGAERVVAGIDGVADPRLAQRIGEPPALTYRTTAPNRTNPAVIAALVAAGASIVSVTCTSATLEDVYATAVAASGAHASAEVPPRAYSVASVPRVPESRQAASAAMRTGWDDSEEVSASQGSPSGGPTPAIPEGSQVSQRSAAGGRIGFSAPGLLATTWLIAKRAAVEAYQDRLSLLMGVGFAVVVPVLLVVLEVRSVVASGEAAPGTALAFNMLIVGLLPTVSAVGIASGQFAGEKERGILTPLLASPASNLAIFGGKVLGAIIPPLSYSAVAEVVYLLALAALFGPAELLVLPLALSVAMVALVPLVTCFAATVSSLISSRVRTYNAAQQLGGLVLMPVWGIVAALAANLLDWGPVGLLGAVLGLLLADVALAIVAAATWRREEVLSHS